MGLGTRFSNDSEHSERPRPTRPLVPLVGFGFCVYTLHGELWLPQLVHTAFVQMTICRSPTRRETAKAVYGLRGVTIQPFSRGRIRPSKCLQVPHSRVSAGAVSRKFRTIDSANNRRLPPND